MEHNDYSSTRATFLTIFLATAAGIGFVAFLMLITGGLFIDMLVVAVGVVGLGLLNYFLWGRSMNRDTAGEREEEQARAQLNAEEWSPSGTRFGPDE